MIFRGAISRRNKRNACFWGFVSACIYSFVYQNRSVKVREGALTFG